jgi:Ca2+-binding RTX toxin-like protein
MKKRVIVVSGLSLAVFARCILCWQDEAISRGVASALMVSGNDQVFALGGNDEVHGGTGDDFLDGGPGGFDNLLGEAGNDRLTAHGCGH